PGYRPLSGLPSCPTRRSSDLGFALESLRPNARAVIEKEYRKMLREERQEFDQSRSVEKIVSGFVALGIGVYGYYFDVRNTGRQLDRKSTRLNSSHVKISYAVF